MSDILWAALIMAGAIIVAATIIAKALGPRK
jgi:hypothetical protein